MTITKKCYSKALKVKNYVELILLFLVCCYQVVKAFQQQKQTEKQTVKQMHKPRRLLPSEVSFHLLNLLLPVLPLRQTYVNLVLALLDQLRRYIFPQLMLLHERGNLSVQQVWQQQNVYKTSSGRSHQLVLSRANK